MVVAAAMAIVVAALTVVGLTALRVTAPSYQPGGMSVGMQQIG